MTAEALTGFAIFVALYALIMTLGYGALKLVFKFVLRKDNPKT